MPNTHAYAYASNRKQASKRRPKTEDRGSSQNEFLKRESDVMKVTTDRRSCPTSKPENKATLQL